MKKLFLVPVLFLLFFATACDEQQKIDAIRTGQQTAQLIATGVKAGLAFAHSSGNLSDEKWAAFLKLYDKYEKADKLLTDGLATWEAGVGKTPVERLLEFLKNINVILQDINDLIATWKTTEGGRFSVPLSRHLAYAKALDLYWSK